MEKVGNNSLLPLRKGETNINLHILQWKYQYPPPSEGGQRGMKHTLFTFFYNNQTKDVVVMHQSN